jgi:hypothetical protein
VADWKKHKTICNTSINQGNGAQLSTPLNPEVPLWFQKHIKEIVIEAHRMITKLGFSMQDLVVEVDLKTSSDPPVVVKPFSVYVCGNQAGPGMPDWGCRRDSQFVLQLKDAHSRCTGNNLLLVHRSCDADYGVCRSTIGTQSRTAA